MYCSTCGAESRGKLSYCIKCGASLNQTPVVAVTLSPALVSPFLLTIAAVCIGGLLVTLDETARMVQAGAGAGKVVPIAFIGALTTFGIASLLIGFLWRTTRWARGEAPSGGEHQKISGPAPGELTAPPASLGSVPASLDSVPASPGSVPASLGSVTEQTTRALDPPLETQ
jgi:hypothetical protein